jgi:hypothetical protein
MESNYEIPLTSSSSSPSTTANPNKLQINYRKLRPLDIDSLAKQYLQTEDDIAIQYNPFYVHEIQSYSPLYNDFFLLNNTNCNRIGLKHRYYLEGSAIKLDEPENDHSCDSLQYYVKCSPLLDPIHYLVGKYHNATNIRVLPTLTNKSECFAKIASKHNASYVDGFFSYLSSQVKHTHNMLNAVDFYGSYLAVQKVFKATVTDDIDYLNQSKYFIDLIGKGVTIRCGTDSGNTFDDFTGIGSRANKKRLVLEDEIDCSDICIDVLDLSENPNPGSEEQIDLNVNTDSGVVCEYEKSESDETVSESSESSEEDEDDDLTYSSSNASVLEDEEEEEDDDTYSQDEEQEVYAYIENFPANLIFLEKCDGTLDSLLLNQQIDKETAASCLMQIVMSLIAFQKAFHFTHNDLHTNNVMYVNTDIEFLYYKYDNRFYRVPTYGKIFKLIDFGRSIYRFKDQIYCSDSFAPKGDAHSQYNTEPYFNDKHPRVEPNLSFDLCRLGTSIYDFIIQDEKESRDEFQETIYRWCLDDNGKNVMYRRDGEERYPGFKLYKMIARNVHGHTPQEQLKYPFFSQFLVVPLEAAKLDLTEVRKHGLNLDLVEREYL